MLTVLLVCLDVMSNVIKQHRMQAILAGLMFSPTAHILKAYCTKHGSFFIEYLAHSSFKDFALANCFYWGINYEF